MSDKMKVIMERWDRFVVKEQAGSYTTNCKNQFDNAGQFSDAYKVAFLVATKDKRAKDALDKLQVGAEWAMGFGGVLAAAGLATGGATTVLGGTVAAFAGLGNLVISAIRSGRNKKFDKRIMDTIFAALCIDPAILELTDDDLEEKIFKEKAPFNDMQNYLSGLDRQDPVPDINALFIAEINNFLEQTKQSVVKDRGSQT
tara:strand:+ start:15 stop:614 length:600 start_codon:yes stop_codon:yes gene_type:complete